MTKLIETKSKKTELESLPNESTNDLEQENEGEASLKSYQALLDKSVFGNRKELVAGPNLWSPNYRSMTKEWGPLTDYQWAAISPFFNDTGHPAPTQAQT